VRRNQKHGRWALLFLGPSLLGLIAFTLGPILYSLWAAMTNLSLQKAHPTRFTGFENFGKLMHDQEFHYTIANTIYFLVGAPFAILGSLILAVLLNRKWKGMTAFRALLYLPSFTSGVAIMILWKTLYSPEFGPINGFLRTIGIEGPKWLLATQNLLGMNVETLNFVPQQFGIGAREALILMGMWAAVGGGNMLLYLAALHNVPEELIEASQLDGAGRWASFKSVVWPQLAPTNFFILVMTLIAGLQGGFEQARVMTQGGPAGTTTTISYYIYRKAFEEFEIGYASAISWALFIVVFAATLTVWKFGNREESLA
jgi:multiple sugar transport system permease protein